MIIASLGRERSAEHAQASCEYIFKAQNVKKNVASLAAVSQGHITFVFEVNRREVKIFEFYKKKAASRLQHFYIHPQIVRLINFAMEFSFTSKLRIN